VEDPLSADYIACYSIDAQAYLMAIKPDFTLLATAAPTAQQLELPLSPSPVVLDPEDEEL
jgi:hypothetical protein